MCGGFASENLMGELVIVTPNYSYGVGSIVLFVENQKELEKLLSERTDENIWDKKEGYTIEFRENCILPLEFLNTIISSTEDMV